MSGAADEQHRLWNPSVFGPKRDTGLLLFEGTIGGAANMSSAHITCSFLQISSALWPSNGLVSVEFASLNVCNCR